jgi:hypothetical protein
LGVELRQPAAQLKIFGLRSRYAGCLRQLRQARQVVLVERLGARGQAFFAADVAQVGV